MPSSNPLPSWPARKPEQILGGPDDGSIQPRQAISVIKGPAQPSPGKERRGDPPGSYQNYATVLALGAHTIISESAEVRAACMIVRTSNAYIRRPALSVDAISSQDDYVRKWARITWRSDLRRCIPSVPFQINGAIRGSGTYHARDRRALARGKVKRSDRSSLYGTQQRIRIGGSKYSGINRACSETRSWLCSHRRRRGTRASKGSNDGTEGKDNVAATWRPRDTSGHGRAAFTEFGDLSTRGSANATPVRY